MSPNSPADPADIFAEAIERPASERAAFIEIACASDEVLAGRVRRLVESHQRAEALLPDPEALSLSSQALAALERLEASPDVDPLDSMLIGRTIDGFHIVRLLGAGGMGAVFEAKQEHPARSVALKILRLGVTSRAMLRRFEFEAEVLGRLRHPGIAQVYQTGTFDDGTGGVPYFAMEFIPEALDIVRYANEASLDADAKLDLFARICDAVHHGHQRSIIHRDLKPANILIDGAGQPKVIDFGVARSTDSDIAASTLHTQAGALIGTILYMSPEQIAGDPDEIDTRSDVYSLGIILYEMLAGKLPYDLDRRSLAESARQIREQAPARISSIRREFRGDVQTILDTCLEKEPDRRYQSAASLAEDIRRYRRREPIVAAPPSVRYRAGRFVRRNPVLVSAAAMVLLALTAGFTVAARGWYQATTANQRSTEESLRRQRALDFVVGLLRTPAPGVEGADVRVIDALAGAEAQISVSLAEDPALELAIRTVLGEVLFGLGRFDDAERHFDRAIDLAKQRHGVDSIEAATALGGRGTALTQLRRLDEAEALLREALATRRRAGGDSGDDHALVMSQLAAALDLMGRIDEAETVFEEALALCAPEAPARMEILAGLGVVAFRRQDMSRAIEYSQQAYDLAVLQRGVAHPDTIALMNNIAFFKGKTGDQKGQLEVYRRAIATGREELDESHPMLAQLLVNLGDAAQEAGEIDAARAAFEEAVEIRRLRLGDSHFATAQARYKLAFNLQAGDLARSAELLMQVVQPYQSEYGIESHENCLLMLNLGRTLGNLNRHLESEPFFRDAYEAARHLDRPAQERRCLGSYVNARIRNHRFDEETERLCLAMIELDRRRREDPEAASRPHSRHLFVLLCRQRRFDDAIVEAEKALRDPNLAEHVVTSWRVNLGMALLDGGRTREAQTVAASLSEIAPADARLATRVLGFRGAAALARGDAELASELLYAGRTSQTNAQIYQTVPTVGRIELELSRALVDRGEADAAVEILQAAHQNLTIAWGEDDWLTQAAVPPAPPADSP